MRLSERIKEIAKQYDKYEQGGGGIMHDWAAGTSALESALDAVEWVDGDGYTFCPWCGGLHDKGHKPDCLRQSAIAKSEEAAKYW